MRKTSEKKKGKGKAQQGASRHLMMEPTQQQQTCPDHNGPGKKSIVL